LEVINFLANIKDNRYGENENHGQEKASHEFL
jgi:hypothetical protein